MRASLSVLVVVVLLAVLTSLPRAHAAGVETIRFATSAEADAARERITRAIWAGGLPTRGPDAVERGASDPVWGTIPGLARIDRLTIQQPGGAHALPLVFWPVAENGRAIVVHGGHGPFGGVSVAPWNAAAVARLVAEGYVVVAIAMPLSPPNPAPFAWHEGFWDIDNPPSRHALAWFLEPVVVAVTHLRAERPGIPVAMTGYSGGGWTTDWASALDARIGHAYPVAGSLPLPLRRPEEYGDLEQFAPEVYGPGGWATYSELYALGAHRRTFVQVTNLYDNCCFSGDRRSQYVPAVQEAVARIGGAYQAHIDATHPHHMISPSVLDAIIRHDRDGQPFAILGAAITPTPAGATNLTITSVADVDARRAQLRALVWPTGYPASRRPDVVSAPFMTDWWRAIPNLAEVRFLVVHQAHGLDVAGWHLKPAVSNGRSIVLHHGHQWWGDGDADWRRIHGRFIAAGYEVVAVTMPTFWPSLHGQHNGQVIDTHEKMAALRTSTLHPLSLFLAPTIAAINYLHDATGRPTVDMGGLSGGGWATTLMAAIEPRIIRSYPVAGSLPLDSRIPIDIGDWEQHDPEFFGLASYEDLYVMAAVGPGRGQLQILNEDDGCCFRVSGRPPEAFAYVDAVRQRAAALGGSWQFFVVPDQYWHTITDLAIDRIMADQGVSPPATWTPTPTMTGTPTQTPVPTMTWTPTAPATRTPTSDISPYHTATPVVYTPGSCSPRPPVRVQTSVMANGLAVTVTSLTPIRSVTFGQPTNAAASSPGINGGTATFSVVRSGPGAYTVPFTVHDGCGAWQTFVGQGS